MTLVASDRQISARLISMAWREGTRLTNFYSGFGLYAIAGCIADGMLS